MNKFGMWLVCSIFFLMTFAVASRAETLNEVKQSKTSVDNKLDSIEQQKKKEQQNLQKILEKKKKLAEILKSMDLDKKKMSAAKKTKEDELAILEDNEENAVKKYNEAMVAFKNRVRSMYMSSGKTALDVLLASNNILEFSSRIYILKLIAKKDKDVMEDFKTAKKQVELVKNIKKLEKDALEKKLEQTGNAMASVNSDKTDAEKNISAINSRLKKLEFEEDRLLQTSKDLANKIKSFTNPGKKFVGGQMQWPSPGNSEVTSPFGWRFHPVLQKRRYHTGVDIGAQYGDAIVAANAGTVKMAEWDGGYGNLVIIDHGGGITTLYAHCSRILVRSGKSVSAGETIAKIGSTGISTGPHLHFEVRVNGEPVNPLKYFGR